MADHVRCSPRAGLLGTIDSVLKTVNIFVSNNTAVDNADFLVDRGVWPSATPFGKQVPLDPSNLRTGDYLAITRLDGLDPMIAFGTGERRAQGGMGRGGKGGSCRKPAIPTRCVVPAACAHAPQPVRRQRIQRLPPPLPA